MATATRILKARVGRLNRIFRLIKMDLKEYSKDKDGFLDINECDIEHLNLRALNREWKDQVPLEKTLKLPRALKLRVHVLMAFTYRKNLNLLKLLKDIAAAVVAGSMKKKTREEVVTAVTTMYTLETQVYNALHRFALKLEESRKKMYWGKNSVHRACARVLIAADRFVKGEADDIGCWRTEAELSFMCNHCKEFGMKAESMMEELSEEFRSIVVEYYLDPIHAKESLGYREAVTNSREILRELGFAFTIEIGPMVFKLPLPKHITIHRDHNVTMCRLYDSDRYPNRKGKGMLMIMAISRPLKKEIRYLDLNSPIPNSLTQIGLNHRI